MLNYTNFILNHIGVSTVGALYGAAMCNNGGYTTSYTSPDHQWTRPGAPGPHPKVTGTRRRVRANPPRNSYTSCEQSPASDERNRARGDPSAQRGPVMRAKRTPRLTWVPDYAAALSDPPCARYGRPASVRTVRRNGQSVLGTRRWGGNRAFWRVREGTTHHLKAQEGAH